MGNLFIGIWNFQRGKSIAIFMENLQTIVLGGGCFWCLEAVFDRMEGVTSVESGYMGGHVTTPHTGKCAAATPDTLRWCGLLLTLQSSASVKFLTCFSPSMIPRRPTARAMTWVRNIGRRFFIPRKSNIASRKRWSTN